MTERVQSPGLHLIKLCVGAESVRDLADWQARRVAERRRQGHDPRPRHVTRMWPRRAEELLAGGALYWVIGGLILVRQRIAAMEEARGEDGIRRCAIVLDPDLIRTEPRPRRPFQGWRYIKAEDAPADLPRRGEREDRSAELPPEMQHRLAEIGVRER